jgi:hypothetical protein
MNPSEQEKATADIYYEAQMLYRGYSEYWIDQGRNRHPRTWIHNSIVEATVIHMRALLDFFERSRSQAKARPRADDILCEDYGFAAQTLPIRSDLRDRINKAVAHMSYFRTRVRNEDRNWEFEALIPEILGRASDFFQHLLDGDVPRSDWPGDPKLREFISNVAAIRAKHPVGSTLMSVHAEF